MGLTYAQAKELGLGHLHPAAAGRKSKELELLDSLYAGPPRPSQAPQDGLNKTERAFRDDVLEPAWVRGAIANYWREPIKLRLAGRTWYTPDFLVASCEGEHGLPKSFTFVEIKGFMRDDAAVKLKVAAETYREFTWLLVRREGRHGWEVRDVTSAGISVVTRRIPWIHG